MDKKITLSLELQQAIGSRLEELGYADVSRIQSMSRHLAEVAAVSKDYAENTLPLLLRLDGDNSAALMQVALAIKSQMEELTDTLADLRRELPEWSEFFVNLPNG